MMLNQERRSIIFNCPICHFQQRISCPVENGLEVAVACEKGSHGFFGVIEGRELRFTGKVIYASMDDVSRLVRELAEKTVCVEQAKHKARQTDSLINFYRNEVAEIVKTMEAMNQSVDNISLISEIKENILAIDPGISLQ